MTATTPEQVHSLHSRSVAAGYDPDVLGAARVLVVGAGALGQNLILDLALAGVGRIGVVDFDRFEPHNATRSPFYPSPDRLRRFDGAKAPLVAEGALALSTAHDPHLYWTEAYIQELGDGAVAWADVVCCAVDNGSARAWLADRCRLLETPMVEGGFHASAGHVAVYGPDPKDPCWRCGAPDVDGVFSCTQYALAVEADRVVPAIQNTAAALAARQAEATIRRLHGDRHLAGHRYYDDVRDWTQSRTVELSANPDCPGVHYPACDTIELDVTSSDSLADLSTAIEAQLGPASIRLPVDFVRATFCPACGTLARVDLPVWAWARERRCQACGGPHRPEPTLAAPSVIAWLGTATKDSLVALTTCAEAGLPAGSHIEIHTDSRILLGTLSDQLVWQRATASP
ncbi:MAG: ThiF family adenylyltransferase [Acidimicrobiia bacterium]|nr:ThiF family adenylyltransferase [Acidimicrobiia bacterium]